MRFIASMDPNEGRRYVELVKEEIVGGWDHVYNISKDYVHPTSYGELGWKISSSASLDYNDALENWYNWIHEVSIRIFG